MIGMFGINTFPGSDLRDIPSSEIASLLEIACIHLKFARSRIHVVSARKLFAPCLQVSTPGKGLAILNSSRRKLFQSPLILVNSEKSSNNIKQLLTNTTRNFGLISSLGNTTVEFPPISPFTPGAELAGRCLRLEAGGVSRGRDGLQQFDHV